MIPVNNEESFSSRFNPHLISLNPHDFASCRAYGWMLCAHKRDSRVLWDLLWSTLVLKPIGTLFPPSTNQRARGHRSGAYHRNATETDTTRLVTPHLSSNALIPSYVATSQ